MPVSCRLQATQAAAAGDGDAPLLSNIVSKLDLDLLGVIWSIQRPDDASDVMHANAMAAAEVVAAVEQLRLFSAVVEARATSDVAANPPVWSACCSSVAVGVEHVTTVLLYSLSDDLVANVLPAADEPLETMWVLAHNSHRLRFDLAVPAPIWHPCSVRAS